MMRILLLFVFLSAPGLFAASPTLSWEKPKTMVACQSNEEELTYPYTKVIVDERFGLVEQGLHATILKVYKNHVEFQGRFPVWTFTSDSGNTMNFYGDGIIIKIRTEIAVQAPGTVRALLQSGSSLRRTLVCQWMHE